MFPEQQAVADPRAAGGPVPATRSLLVELTALAVAVGIDAALLLRPTGYAGHSSTGWHVLSAVWVPSIATLTLLRRWFPRRTLFLGLWVLFFCALGLAAAVVQRFWDTGDAHRLTQPFATQVLCLLVVVSALCRRRSLVCASSFSLVAGVVTTADLTLQAPGGLGRTAVLGVALSWGFAVATGTMLRDADHRQVAELSSIRSDERLSLARDLHDLVAHHVAGIVVQAQAVETVAVLQGRERTDELDMITDIAQAGSKALQAIRYLIGTARSDSGATATNLHEAVLNAVGDDDQQPVYLSLPSDLSALECPAELVVTLHRIVLESLTNARKYSATGSPVAVTVQVGSVLGLTDALVVEVVNERGTSVAAPAARGGFGLVGMSERARMIGGRLEAGPYDQDRWKVTVALPLDLTEGRSRFSRQVI
ncbi:histidine kinase [Streptomyces sp. V4-01]|uniref:histidine kinase n=1 Tax=Actinacidiphila polyblastidii TaxID=3110430 RepID=A0ABU7PFA5_9ACTN|nr:histidine kinase [Streptomyces sp. V4-01]